MAFKELFTKYKIYTIISIVAVLLLVAGGVVAGLFVSKQENQQLTVPAVAADFTDSNGLEYTILSSIDLTVSVSGYIGIDTEVIIPETVVIGGDTYTVTTIAGGSSSTGVFANNTTLSSITIPSTITRISSYAFYTCRGLTEINFNATNMSDLNSNNRVFYNAGRNGSGITVNIGANVERIPAYLFYPYTSNYGSYVPKIVTINFAENSQCKSIGNYAFYAGVDLTTINFNAINMEDLSSRNYIFYNAGTDGTGITVNIGANVERIPAYLFYPYGDNSSYAPKIITVNFTENSQCGSIGDSAFRYCDDLIDVTIPKSVTSIGYFAFANCSGLTNVYYAGDINDWVNIDFGNSTANPLNYADNLYLGGDTNNPVTSININAVATIKDDALYGWTGLQSVTIGNQVTSIGDSAFYNCSNLTSVFYLGDINDWVSIDFGGRYANPLYNSNVNLYLNGNTSTPVTSINIDTATTIGAYSFYNWIGLQSVTIDSQVTSIGYSAFSDCSGLTNVYYAGDINAWVSIDFGNSTANPLNYADNLYLGGDTSTPVTSINIDTTTTIGACSLYGWVGLQSVTIGSQVTSIGEYAFDNCTSLTEITIPDSVTSIGGGAFYNCSKLTSVYYVGDISDWVSIDFGNETANPLRNSSANLYLNGDTNIPFEFEGVLDLSNATSIGACSFYNQTGITGVIIGNQVTSIGSSAFRGCSGLTSVYYSGDINDWVSIDFGNEAANPLRSSSANLYLNGNRDTPFEFEGVLDLSNATSIGVYSFYNQTGITGVIIGNQVTSIGNYAFYGCTALTEINFNATNMNDLESYNNVFYNAGKDGTGIIVNIGANVTRIPAYLFNPTSSSSYYPHITAVNFLGTSQCESIGNYAFSYCDDLTNITIPDSVISIGERAFYYCSSLHSLTIGSGVSSIGERAFYYCSGLTSVTIGSGITSIGEYAFYNCTALTEINFNATNMNDLSSRNDVFTYAGQNGAGIAVNIGANVTRIPAYLFNPRNSGSYSPYITAVNFLGTSQCKSIGNYAFYYCNDLTSIIIPNSVTKIGAEAFYNCSGLTSVTIGDSVTSIGDSAFGGCSGLTSIAIPDSVISIEESAFYNCSGLTSVTIPNSVTSIGNYAFENCSGLTSITIPNSVTSIGSSVFSGCTSLTSVAIGSGITSIGNSAFSDCNDLENVYYAGDINAWVSIDFGNSYANPLYYARDFYLNNQTVTSISGVINIDTATEIKSYSLDNGFYGSSLNEVTSIIIGNQVTSIGNSAFSDCSGLTEVTIPNSVTSIGNYAFSDCNDLTSVYYAGDINDWVNIDFGNSEANPLSYADNLYLNRDTSNPVTSVNIDISTSIGNYAFNGWTGLQSITIGNQVTNIGNSAFYGCTSLTNITIPDSITNIGNSAFYGCTSLTNITIPDSITSIGNSAFYGCTSLTNIIIPDSVTSIGNSAFFGCSGLTSVVLSNNITAIEESTFEECISLNNVLIPNSTIFIRDRAFYHCISLTEIVIPDNVQFIGESAFYGCGGLTSVSMGSSVASIGESAFEECNNLSRVYFYNDISDNTNTIGNYAFRYNASAVLYLVKDSTSLTNIQAIYNSSNAKFTSNNFKIMANIQVYIADNSVGFGEVSISQIVGVGDECILIATPNENYEVLGWSFNSDGSDIIPGSEWQTNYTIAAPENATYYVVFIKFASIQIESQTELGSVYMNGVDVSNTIIDFSNQSNVILMALPKQNSTFLYWEITTSSGMTQVADNPLLVAPENATIKAVYGSGYMEGVGIGVTAIGGGQVRIGGYNLEIDETTTIVLNAICYSGYTFTGWYYIEGDVEYKIEEFGNSDAITINAIDYVGKLIIAKFTKIANEDINEDLDNS